MSTTWFLSPTTIVLPNPIYGAEVRPARLQRAGAAIGGRVVVADYTDGSQLRRPTFTYRLDWTSEWLVLKAFIETNLEERGNTFTFTDWEGDFYTCRYWRGIETAARIKAPANKMEVAIELREVPA